MYCIINIYLLIILYFIQILTIFYKSKTKTKNMTIFMLNLLFYYMHFKIKYLNILIPISHINEYRYFIRQ